jgi:hypothetical protein
MRASPRQGMRGLRGRSASNSYYWWGARLHPLTLCLPIKMAGVKPAGAMKTLSGRFRFVVLAVIVIVVVVSCCYFPSIPDTRISLYSVEIGGKQRDPRYRPWKDKNTFDIALDQVCAAPAAHHATYEFYVKLTDSDPDPTHLYRPCRSNPPGNIRTVKVTKSKVADDIAAGESAANDPNAMHRVQSSDPSDIKNVLDALKK